MAVIMMHATATSIDADEVARFAALADEWWDPHGGMAALHRLNPVRIAYIRDHLARHFGRDPVAERPLAGLRLLDIGCGAGLLCEPMARLGAEVIADICDRYRQPTCRRIFEPAEPWGIFYPLVRAPPSAYKKERI